MTTTAPDSDSGGPSVDPSHIRIVTDRRDPRIALTRGLNLSATESARSVMPQFSRRASVNDGNTTVQHQRPVGHLLHPLVVGRDYNSPALVGRGPKQAEDGGAGDAVELA